MHKSTRGLPFLDVFVRCAEAIGGGKLIMRESRQDKEFHFQNWFKARLIESGSFPFEFVSELAEMESWRKEVYRPIYHIHKWWAKRLWERGLRL